MQFDVKKLISRLAGRAINQTRRRNRRRLPPPLRFEALEDRTMLTTFFVTDDGDAGLGTLRAAVDGANADASPTSTIVISRDIDTIQLASPVVYTADQKLRIIGKGATIEPVSGSEGTFDLFVSEGGADLNIKNLTVQKGADGIFVPVPADAAGLLTVSINRVTVRDNVEFGLHVDDQLNVDPETRHLNLSGADSDASILLKARRSSFTGNGTGVLDRDGIRLDEGGPGNITARLWRTHVDANGGDGFELDERGTGGVRLNVDKSTFDENGFFNVADLDDGLDIDEADAGGIWARLVDSTLNRNLDEGLDFDEEHEGNVVVSLAHVEASDNIDEGIKVDEEGEGGLTASLRHVEASRNGTEQEIEEDPEGEEGIALREADDGHLVVSLVHVTANDNGNPAQGGDPKEGIDISEEGDGSIWALLVRVDANRNFKVGIKIEEADNGKFSAVLRHVTANDNGHNGIQLEETGDGNLLVRACRVTAINNAKSGLKVEQEDAGAGLLILIAELLDPNGDGPLDTSGVTVI